MKRTYEQTQPVGQPVTTPSSSGQSQQAQPTEPRGLNERILNDLAGKIGHKWTHLAVRLEFQDAEIENFRADHPRSQKERTFQMLKTWWQRWDHLHDADGSGAQDDLCDALEKTGRNDLILFLRGSEDGAGHFNLDAYRDEFIRYYQDEMSVVPLLPWLPSEVSSIHDIYVKPELQERQDKARKVKTRTIESHEDMFKLEYEDGEPVRFILLSGIAGSGKTTNVSKIATDWALQTPRSTSSLSKFTFLVVLSMRELKGVPDLTKAIFDQILAQDTNLDRKSLTTYLSSHAEKVLVVLDGADEYDKEGSQLPSEGFINNIIRNKILRGCTVIVTTRPHMVDKLCKLNPSFIHIETRGFSDEGVQKYIQKFFKGDDSEDSGGLYEYLKASETLRSLARTPIMLLLMCLVWSDEQKLPETLTELFKEALLFILKRHFEKSGLPIPEDKELLENQLIDLLQTLGKEALDGLLLFGQKLVFEARDFGNSEVVDKACKIGILSKEKIRSKLRAVESVTFFHKTFQEAIAGFYWASLVESDNELFKSYLSKVDKSNALGMEYLMRFCCGGNVKAAESLLRFVETFGLKTEVPDDPDHVNFFRDSNEPFRRLWILMHYEAHSEELHSIARAVFNHVFLVKMNCGNDFTSALKFLVECETSSGQSLLTKLKQVIIKNVRSKGEASLVSDILRYSPDVTDVFISTDGDNNEVSCLGEALSRMQSLEKLQINGTNSLASKLRVVDLERVSLCRDSFPSFAEQLKSLKELNELKLSFRIGSCSEDIITLAKDVLPSLQRNLRVLEVFIPTESSTDPEAFMAVMQWACASPSMNALKFQGCVCPHRTNVSKPDSIDAVNTLQPTPSPIQRLNVSRSSLGPCTAAFMRLLEQMPFLKKLYMEDMSFVESDWTDLVEVLKGCQQLQDLHLRGNVMTSSDLEAVLRLIPRLPDLQWLILPKTFQGTGYYVHSVPMAWAQAKEFCQKMRGNLLMPKSSEENAFAKSLLQQRRATTAWLNCHRVGQWLCEVDGVAMWPPFNNPAPDQPTLDGNCLTMKAEDGTWRHTYCDLNATTVCEREATVQQASLAMHCMTIAADGRPVTDGQCVQKP
ncbi:uncharacterized protein LOC119736807 [Patiria miniata]|uniref:NACHT domain-containing protein n=1 Tax=Patiria miniata TaxID=46514 RepID=A0A914ATD6_PATMI|nr:uncharacterized protein LOC119736807 [Patiria miniata]